MQKSRHFPYSLYSFEISSRRFTRFINWFNRHRFKNYLYDHLYYCILYIVIWICNFEHIFIVTATLCTTSNYCSCLLFQCSRLQFFSVCQNLNKKSMRRKFRISSIIGEKKCIFKTFIAKKESCHWFVDGMYFNGILLAYIVCTSSSYLSVGAKMCKRSTFNDLQMWTNQSAKIHSSILIHKQIKWQKRNMQSEHNVHGV